MEHRCVSPCDPVADASSMWMGYVVSADECGARRVRSWCGCPADGLQYARDAQLSAEHDVQRRSVIHSNAKVTTAVSPVRHSSQSGFVHSAVRVLPLLCSHHACWQSSYVCATVHAWQGRTLGENTADRCRRRSFMPSSFFEDDTADFADELDTSFFTRVSSDDVPRRKQ